MRGGNNRQGVSTLVVPLSLAIIMLGGMWSCAKAVPPERPKPVPGGVKFTVSAPGARHIVVVGSFNGWAKDATPMTIVDGTLWSVTVPLNVGEHSFMYVIDGVQWITPPQAEDFVTDGFGQTNGVVIVR